MDDSDEGEEEWNEDGNDSTEEAKVEREAGVDSEAVVDSEVDSEAGIDTDEEEEEEEKGDESIEEEDQLSRWQLCNTEKCTRSFHYMCGNSHTLYYCSYFTNLIVIDDS